MTKKALAALLAALMLLVGFSPVATVATAASTDPFCRIAYDSAVGCNTVKYYKYSNGVAKFDATRLVKFYDGKILLGTSNTVITTNHKQGTNPAWTTDGSYLVWFESDSSLAGRAYSGSANIKLADNASSLGLNAEDMVATVTFADGSSKNIDELLPSSATATAAPVSTAEVAATAKPQATSTPAPQKPVQTWTDSADRQHVKFGRHKVIVDGKNVYFDKYLISELCNSGVRYLGVDTSYRVYLYEDSSASYYRFKPSNLFKPDKIALGELESIQTDKNGYLSSVTTAKGTYTLAQLALDRDWYPVITYAINKKSYATLYVKGTSKKYTLTLKGNKLYLGKKLVAKGISRRTESFGFVSSTKFAYLKNGKKYVATIKKQKARVAKKKVIKLSYSTKNGLVK